MRPLRLFALIAALCAAPVAAADRIELPPGPDRDLVYARCRTCHDLQYVKDSAGITRGNWSALISDMVRYGMRIPADERARILAYLGTYLGPDPAPAASTAERSSETSTSGEAVYARQCSSCHQSNGMGVRRTFPPLAGNSDLFIDRLFPVLVVLNGLRGPININGERFDGEMPPFDHLPDAQIAAVVRYVRSAWNNDQLRPEQLTSPVDAEAVRGARNRSMTKSELHAYREERIHR